MITHENARRILMGKASKQQGEAWQNEFETRCRALAQHGILTVARTPEEMKKIKPLTGGLWACAPSGKGPADFILLSAGLAIGAECKATLDDHLSTSVVEPHQQAFLDSYDRQGGIGVVAALVAGDRWILLWRELKNVSTFRPSASSIPMDDGGEWIEKLRYESLVFALESAGKSK